MMRSTVLATDLLRVIIEFGRNTLIMDMGFFSKITQNLGPLQNVLHPPLVQEP